MDAILDMSPESAVTSLIVMVQDMRDQLDEVRRQVHGLPRRNRDYGGRISYILDHDTAIENAVTSSITFGAKFGIAALIDIRSRLLAQLEAQRLQLRELQRPRAEFAAADHRNRVFRPVPETVPWNYHSTRPARNYHSTRSARPMQSDFETPAGPSAMPVPVPAGPSAMPVPVPAEVPDDNVPSWLCCPITLELIEDPVFSRVSGRTYSRAAILRWLRGSLTDPMTNTRCTERDLFDNLAMREELEQFNNSADRV